MSFNHFNSRQPRANRCLCGEIIPRSQRLCSTCATAFVIRRDPVPGQLNAKPRYFTESCGWSGDLRKAKCFRGRDFAAGIAHEGDTVVALAEAITEANRANKEPSLPSLPSVQKS